MTTEMTEADAGAPSDEIAAIREQIVAELKAQTDAQTREIDAMFSQEIESAPPHLKALIPEELSLYAQVKWLRKARESGASFSNVPATDSRRPTNTPQTVDANSLTPHRRIAAGYTPNH